MVQVSVSRGSLKRVPSLDSSRRQGRKHPTVALVLIASGLMNCITLTALLTTRNRPFLPSSGPVREEIIGPVVAENSSLTDGVHGTKDHRRRRKLHRRFQNVSSSVVFRANFDMGCCDLAAAAPYFRAVADRLFWRGRGLPNLSRRLLLFDIGANVGQDAVTALAAFQKMEGVCRKYNAPHLLISIEPSPSVFCKLGEAAREGNWMARESVRLLNIGMSDKTGSARFMEGFGERGKIIDAETAGPASGELRRMSREEFEMAQTCKTAESSGRKNITEVSTYTMDSLVLSLQDLGMIAPDDGIFVQKIDTESHDINVIRGSRGLLERRRITFVLFEVWDNAKLKEVALFMDSVGYVCFMLTPRLLVPIDGRKWWYENLDVSLKWWGNGLCGIRGSESVAMFWRMYHSDDLEMIDSFELL